MAKTRVYLDNCCFNRPFDRPLTPVVWFEAEAKMYVQSQILAGNIELAWSFILDYENAASPHMNRKDAIAKWKYLATIDIAADMDIFHRAIPIMECGIRTKTLYISRVRSRHSAGIS